MPISYHIDSSRGVVFTTASDSFTVDELLAHKAALLADERFRPGLKELADARGVKGLSLGPADIRRLASFDLAHKDNLGGYSLALVVPDAAAFGLARMYQQITEANLPHVGVFRSIEEAAAWLGVG